jgi:hypothetical protein
MEAVIGVFTIVTPWILFDILALRFGVDSRESIRDDHQR